MTDNVRRTADTGMFAMMAMMMICCVGVLLLFALIPVLGWPIGLTVAVVGGAALMYGHHTLMGHGGHQSVQAQVGSERNRRTP